MHAACGASFAARPPRGAPAARAPSARRAHAHAAAPRRRRDAMMTMAARVRQLRGDAAACTRAAPGEDGAGAPAAAVDASLQEDAVRT
jgi:hypothetical protein